MGFCLGNDQLRGGHGGGLALARGRSQPGTRTPGLGSKEAAAYMALRLSRPDHIANFQAMAEILMMGPSPKVSRAHQGTREFGRF